MPNIFTPPHDCKINTRDCGLSQSFTSALCVVEHILLWSVLRRTGRNIAPLVTGSTLSSFKYKNSTCPSHGGGKLHSRLALLPHVHRRGFLYQPSGATLLSWIISTQTPWHCYDAHHTLSVEVQEQNYWQCVTDAGYPPLPNSVDGNMHLIFR